MTKTLRPFFCALLLLPPPAFASPESGLELFEETYLGLPHYKVVTVPATYWLERSGGGLSRMVDRDGNDWLGFNPAPGSGAGGEFRGFPNAVHQQQGNYFHPRNKATDPATLKIETRDLSRLVISAVSSNGLWACSYEFTGTHCTFTMTRMPADSRYWVLYEGMPGGSFDDTDWWMTSAVKTRRSLTTPHDGDIPAPEWIAFGGIESPRVLLLLHLEDDAHPDRFYPMQSKMTVFGFGRSGTRKFLDRVPQSFVIGFVEATDHPSIRATAERLLKQTETP